MRFVAREGRKSDFEAWFTMECQCFQRGKEWKANAEREWFTFFEQGVMLSLVIEERQSGKTAPMRAFAGGVFVTDAFSQWLRQGQPPYILTHATLPTVNNRLPLLNETEIAKGNASDGLNFMLTHWTWAEPILSPVAAQDIRILLEQEFFRINRGYQLKEMLAEGFGKDHRKRSERAGFRCINDYQTYYLNHPPAPAPLHYPYLMALTRKEAREQDGCALLRSFSYTPPRLGFSKEEQLVLREALNNRSDRDIAALCNCSEATIRNRWLSIYDTVEFLAPELLLERGKEGKRGKESRSVVLQYVDAHREETRPYAPSKKLHPNSL